VALRDAHKVNIDVTEFHCATVTVSSGLCSSGNHSESDK
jgi:hypothetical protein